MLELRPSFEHCNKPRHPTHLRRASAPTGPSPGGPGDQSDEETSAIPGADGATHRGDEGTLRRRWASQLAALDGVSWIMGTLFYSAEHSRKGMSSPARQRP